MKLTRTWQPPCMYSSKLLKICVGLVIALLGSVQFVYSNEHVTRNEMFNLRGKVVFPRKGNIHFSLLTEEQYTASRQKEKRIDKQEENIIRKSILSIDAAMQQQGWASFVIPDVPAGIYGIIAFQDVNGNGYLDEGLFGPKEPWGTYRHSRPMFSGPLWKEMSFEVNSDLDGMIIMLK